MIFASTGLKVESQREAISFLGVRIWVANKIDELELGYSVASFDYKGPGRHWPKSGFNPQFGNSTNVHYEYGSHIIDEHGYVLSSSDKNYLPKNMFSNFPLSGDSEEIVIYVYQPATEALGISLGSVDYTDEYVNQQFRAMIDLAYSRLTTTLGQAVDASKVTVVWPDEDINLTFTYNASFGYPH